MHVLGVSVLSRLCSEVNLEFGAVWPRSQSSSETDAGALQIYKTIADNKRVSTIRDTDTVVIHEVDPDAPVLLEVRLAYFAH